MLSAGKNDYFIYKDHVSCHSNSLQILQALDSCRFNHDYTNQQQINNKKSLQLQCGETSVQFGLAAALPCALKGYRNKVALHLSLSPAWGWGRNQGGQRQGQVEARG